jgi:hypothetical protein
MKRSFSYWMVGLLAFLLKPDVLLYCQSDSTSFKIIFDCAINLDSVPLPSDDYDISIKMDSITYSLSRGVLAEGDIAIIIPAKRDVLPSEYNSFNFCLNTKECKTDKIVYAVDSARSSSFTLYISAFYAESYSVSFPIKLCNNADAVSLVNEMPVGSINFSSVKGLSIDSVGEIHPQYSIPGNYSIQIESDYCLSANSASVTIVAQPDFQVLETPDCDRTRLRLQINNVENPVIIWSDSSTGIETEVSESKTIWISVTNESGCTTADSMMIEVKRLEIQSPIIDKQESDCWTEGKVEIRTATVKNNVGEYSFRLQNTINNAVVSKLDEVPEGEYNLQVIDSRDCMSVAAEKITVIQKCLEDYPVFTPNNDGMEDQYFIPYQGKIKIYNSENLLVKELESPVYWDGSDQDGNSLPMGNYVMITDHGRPVNITIVR